MKVQKRQVLQRLSEQLGYKVEFDKRVTKDLKKLDPHVASKIIEKCSTLRQDPTKGPNISRLKLMPNLYRLQIGDYRVVYIVERDQVIIKYIKHRKDIYRSL